jgi:hypothetical protein
MALLEEQAVSCPYCGEAIQVVIDHEEAGQQYIEDCQVCCKPIIFKIAVNAAGELSVSVCDENHSAPGGEDF